MCGLVGIAGDLEYKDEATMKRMFVFDYFRGPDSTGLAAVRSKDNEVLITKLVSHPIDLFDMGSFKKALNGSQSKVFLGHNRAATVGKVNAINAHPFQVGNIVGAHNGTLDQESWKRLEDALGEQTEVDSYAIFACINKIGIEDTIKLLQTGRTYQKGAWALVWVDLKDNTLNFIRNKHRPLWYCYNDKFNKIFWGSEHEIIEAATSMSSQGYKLHTTDKGYRFFQFAEDWLYSYDLDELVSGYKDRPAAMIQKIEGREPPPVVEHQAPFQHGGMTNSGTTTSTMTSLGRPPSVNDDDDTKGHGDVIDLIGNEFEPLGGYIPQDEFDALAKYGCSWCGDDVNYDDVGVVVLENCEAVLCADCAGLDEGQSRIYTDSYNHEQFRMGLLS